MLLQDAIWTDLELLAPEQRVMELEEVSRDAWHSPIAKQDTDLHELKEINVSPSCYCLAKPRPRLFPLPHKEKVCNFNSRGAVTEITLCPVNTVCRDFWSERTLSFFSWWETLQQRDPAHTSISPVVWRQRGVSTFFSKSLPVSDRTPAAQTVTAVGPWRGSPSRPKFTTLEPGDDGLLFPITSGSMALLCTHRHTSEVPQDELTAPIICHPARVCARTHTHTHTYTQPSRDDSQVHLNPYLNTSNTWLTHVWIISLNKLIDIFIQESRSARWNRWSQPSIERPHILDNNFNYHCAQRLHRSNPLDAQ